MTSAHVLRAQDSPQGYTPSEILGAYDANVAGITGKGQIIAVVGDAFPSESDVTGFWSGVSQLWSNIQLVSVGGGPTGPAFGDQEEITLDTEWSSSIASGAVVRVYGIADLTDPSFDKAFQQVYADLASHPALHQFSNSYGGGEEDNTSAYLETEAQYMANLAGAGVSLFAASADNGADADANGILEVTYPASDPSVTGVGGTSLESLAAPPAEVAWFNSGGGVSGHFPRPAWQTGEGVPGGSNRLVPTSRPVQTQTSGPLS